MQGESTHQMCGQYFILVVTHKNLTESHLKFWCMFPRKEAGTLLKHVGCMHTWFIRKLCMYNMDHTRHPAESIKILNLRGHRLPWDFMPKSSCNLALI